MTRIPELRPLKEGDVIDLGGRKIVVYETPGHTPGGLSFLDVRERIIFHRRCLQRQHPALFFRPRQAAFGGRHPACDREESSRVLEPFYDRNYNGHIGYAANLACLPMPASINSDAIHVCEGILSGEIKGEPAAGGVRRQQQLMPVTAHSASGLTRRRFTRNKEGSRWLS